MSEGSYTIDRYGGTYSLTREPRLSRWTWLTPWRRPRLRREMEAQAIADQVRWINWELYVTTLLVEPESAWARIRERSLRAAAYRRALALGWDGETYDGIPTMAAAAAGARFMAAAECVGKSFREAVRDAVGGRDQAMFPCPVCQAPAGERCNAGLHA